MLEYTQWLQGVECCHAHPSLQRLQLRSHLMMPVKLSLKGWVLMHSKLAEARRGLTFVILAMIMFPGFGVLSLASPRSTSTTGFCKGSSSEHTSKIL